MLICCYRLCFHSANQNMRWLSKTTIRNFGPCIFLKHKDETYDCFANYFRMIETQTGNRVKTLRTDNSIKEINEKVNIVTSEPGIKHELSCPFTQQQNGKAEREKRTLSEATTTVLIDAILPKYLWTKAMLYSAFTINRTGKSSVSDKTPYEVFFNKLPYKRSERNSTLMEKPVSLRLFARHERTIGISRKQTIDRNFAKCCVLRQSFGSSSLRYKN